MAKMDGFELQYELAYEVVADLMPRDLWESEVNRRAEKLYPRSGPIPTPQQMIAVANNVSGDERRKAKRLGLIAA